MAKTSTASRISPYVQQLLEDERARENLRRGAVKLRDAYDRSRKRRVKATQDRKVRSHVKTAARSLGDGASRLVRGAEKPKKGRGRRMMRMLPLAAAGAGAVAIARRKGGQRKQEPAPTPSVSGAPQ